MNSPRQEPAINQTCPINLRDAVAAQPRAIGAAMLRVEGGDTKRTRLKTLRQSGSLRLVFPRTHAREAEVILVNTAGGVTGGDRLDLDITAADDATLSLTTQAAERAYKAQPGEVGQISTRLFVKSAAQLNWLPQELILFNHCNLERRLDVQLDADARFLMVEPVVFGRAAMGERLTDVRFRDRIKIMRDGVPAYIDGMDLNGNTVAHLANPTIADGAAAMASVVLAAPDAARHLTAVRAMLPLTAGASALSDDLLVVRHLAEDSFTLRRDLIPVLEHLNQSPLPMSWRL